MNATAPRRLLGFALRIVISAGLLYLVVRKIPVASFAQSLRQVNLPLMLASYLLIPVMGYINANRTKIMADIQGLTLSINQIVRIGFITGFYSLFLPGYIAGGAIRWHRMSRHDSKPAQAFATIVFTRFLSTIVTVMVGMACWLMDSTARRNLGFGMGFAVLLVGLCSVHWLMFNSGRAQRLANWVVGHRRLPRSVADKLAKVLRSVDKFSAVSASRLASTVALLASSELIGILSFYLIAVAMHLELSPAGIGWVRAYVTLLALLPISIMGMGVRDGSLVVMLRTYEVAPPLAVTYSILLLSRTLVLGLLGGACELWNIMHFRLATSLRAE
ncbi:MAG: flippase-like domain-containing protein [Pseudomonadota bacterium]|nr:flippase-like domain-containing protein [Pseudomonadota bacterium]